MGDAARMLLVGGHPAIDFVNTLGGRPDDPDDEYLHSYAELVTWGQRAGLFDLQASRRLLRAGDRAPQQAADSLAAALDLRTALDGVLRARLTHHGSRRAHLGTLHRAYVAALHHAELQVDDEGCAWTWPEPCHHHPDAAWWPIAVQALDLLDRAPLHRLGRCEHCRWLFLDTSRNHSRRWCSMNACGARLKMRRHRAQRQQDAERHPGVT